MSNMNFPEGRLETLRKKVDGFLFDQPDLDEHRAGFVHLYGVACVAALLAIKRGLDLQLCLAAAMLHDISSYRTNDPADHARRSADEAGTILGSMETWSPDDISQIRSAIAHHSLKQQVDAPMDELLKDADVLQHYLYNPSFPLIPGEVPRLAKLLGELGLPPIEDF
jgi:uncharacterized protein